MKTTPSQEESTEVKLEDFSTVINAVLKTACPEDVLAKAYINAKKEYNLYVNVGDKKGNLYANGTGKWIHK